MMLGEGRWEEVRAAYDWVDCGCCTISQVWKMKMQILPWSSGGLCLGPITQKETVFY